MHEDVRHELSATVEARRELGPAHEQELIDGFLDRIEKEVDRRVDERVAKKVKTGSALNPATLAVCIPIVAIAGGIGHVPGLIAAFAALVIVFVIDSLR